MPTLTEINYAVQGLWRLVHLDERGLEYFDRSLSGFWRSFQVAFLVAPAEALLFTTIIQYVPLGSSWSRILLIEILKYIVAWFIYPVASFELCRWLQRSEAYVGYIVVYNWSAIIGYGVLLLAYGPLMLGWASLEQAIVFGSLARLLWYAYLWFLARRALNVDGLMAGGFILLDFLLSRILDAITYRMML
ncbi:MAG: hypothetical protein AB7S71_23950 [Dongiaceae bacterium]